MGYLYVLGTVLFTVYGQLVLKWRVNKVGALPDEFAAKIWFLLGMFKDPYVFSGFLSAFFASLCWMAALTKLPISRAYPFMSASFVLVLVFSGVFFQEAITTWKTVGMILIVLGIVVGSQG